VANVGDMVCPPICNRASVALLEGCLVTVMVYVSVVIPSCAVTTVVMVLLPTFKGKAGDAAPEATAFPLMLTVETELFVNASALIDVVALDTVDV
jgi:hypothetical protein